MSNPGDSSASDRTADRKDERKNFPQHIQAPLPPEYQQYGHFRTYLSDASSRAGPSAWRPPPPHHYPPDHGMPFNHFPLNRASQDNPSQYPLSFPGQRANAQPPQSQIGTPRYDFPPFHSTPQESINSVDARRRSSHPPSSPQQADQQYNNRPSGSADPVTKSSAGRAVSGYTPSFPSPLAGYPTTIPKTWRPLLAQGSASGLPIPQTTPATAAAQPRTEVRVGRAGTSSEPSGDEVDGSRPTTAEKAFFTGDEAEKRTSDGRQSLDQLPNVKTEDFEDGIDMELDGDGKIDHRKRKRNRTIRSCVPCHNHKRKCDRKRPCGRCTALGLTGTCVYEIDETRDMNDPDVAEADRLRRRIAELEQVVREMRQRAPPRTNPQPAVVGAQVGPSAEDGTDNKKRRVLVDRYARYRVDEARFADTETAAEQKGECDAQGAPTNFPAGTNLTKAPDPNSDEDGSTNSPESGVEDYRAETYDTNLLPGEEIAYDRSGRQTFLGASSGKSMLRKLRELAVSKGDGELISVPEDVAFTGVFPDMRKTFPFTTIWNHENFGGEVMGLLPSKEDAELLWNSWSSEYALYFQPFHLPTLHTEYSRFFAMNMKDKMSVPLSSLSVYLMVCALGCLFRATTSEIFGHPDREVAEKSKGQSMPLRNPNDLTCSRLQSELYLSAAYQALRLCSFMANPTLQALHCQLLIAVYLLVSERAADAWACMGQVIKQAIAIGLHIDPLSLDPNCSMREAEVRRRVWWSIAGYECMLCLFFGRPSVISYYTCNLPQDRVDENLSDAPGSAQLLLPPSNVLSNDTTPQTYHAAYYQLTIPSFEILTRMFHVDRRFSRSAIYGWFSPPPPEMEKRNAAAQLRDEANKRTYQDAVRLAEDISSWYSHLPSGMRFDPDATPDAMMQSRSRERINQTLGLCMKTWTLVLVLHRPYLRLDPSAYPESTEICLQAAHKVLRAYKSMADTRSSLGWSFWSMPYRAFQAGAVCAFMAIRQPRTALAQKCEADLIGAIAAFEDRLRLSTWNKAHPVQADLCEGLVQLRKLVSAATRQQTTSPVAVKTAHAEPHFGIPWPNPKLLNTTPQTPNMDAVSNASFGAYRPFDPLVGATSSTATGSAYASAFSLPPASMTYQTQTQPQGSVPPSNPNDGAKTSTSTSDQAEMEKTLFDTLNSTSGTSGGAIQNIMGDAGSSMTASAFPGLAFGIQATGLPYLPPSTIAPQFSEMAPSLSGDFSGPDPHALPQYWANMFGIKMDQEAVNAW